MNWPSLTAYSISIIQNAHYLTASQKSDIHHNNAARFLRLDPGEDRSPVETVWPGSECML